MFIYHQINNFILNKLIKFIEGLCLDYSRQNHAALCVLYLPSLFGAVLSYSIIFKSDQIWVSQKVPGV